MYTGSLCLINAGNPANGIFLSMTGLAETKNDFYILRDENMVLSIEAAGQLNKMMSDYNAASLVLAYKISHYFGLTIEEVFDFSEIDDL